MDNGPGISIPPVWFNGYLGSEVVGLFNHGPISLITAPILGGGLFLNNCIFIIMAKAKKTRSDKYDEKLAIDGTFDELIKVSVNYTPPKKEKAKKKSAKKK
jgi:hypothetical protein